MRIGEENPTDRQVCMWFERGASRGRNRFCLWRQATCLFQDNWSDVEFVIARAKAQSNPAIADFKSVDFRQQIISGMLKFTL